MSKIMRNISKMYVMASKKSKVEKDVDRRFSDSTRIMVLSVKNLR